MKTNFTLSTKIFAIILLSLFAFITSGFAQESGIDGDYCPAPGINGEYDTGTVFSQMVDPNASSTCEIYKIWAKIYTDPTPVTGGQVLKLGLKIGNSGAALFRVYLNTDNNSATGLTLDQFGGPLAVAGAEYVLELNAKSNAVYTLYKSNDNGSNNDHTTLTVAPNNGSSATNGDSNGCLVSGDGKFLEFNIPFGSIGFDICDPNTPGVITITKLASVSGGSTTSSRCVDKPLSFGIPLTGSVSAKPDTVCAGNSTELTVSGTPDTSTVSGWEYNLNDNTGWHPINPPSTANPYTTANLSQTTQFRAVIMDASLCTATFNTSAVTITVNPGPTLTIANPAAVCSPATVNITSAAVQTANTGTTTRYYSTNALAIAGGTGDVLTPAAIATSGTYYIRSELATGCYVVKSVTVTVNPNLNPPLSGGNKTECKKTSIQTLTATATVPVGQSIVWYDAATNGNIIAVENLTLSDVGTKTYYAQAVDNTTSCISLTRTPVVLTINECSIAIVKTNDIEIENGCANLKVGDVVTYTFAVTNSGNVSLHDVTVVDLHDGLSAIVLQSGDLNVNSILEVGETWIYTATYAVTQDDIDNGEITNQASVSAAAPDDSPVGPDQSGDSTTDDNPNVIPICTAPKIAIVKTNDIVVENGCAALKVGDVVTYTFAVTNSGNVSLHDVTVVDLHDGLSAIVLQSGDLNVNSILEVTETWIYKATYTVTQADIDNGKITNQASVSAFAPDDSPVEPDQSGDSTTDDNPNVIPICNTPDIAIVKTNDIAVENGCASLKVGDVVTYTFTVTNSGNVSLHNVTVVDTHPGLSAIVLQSGDLNVNNKLEVSETWVYTATYAVTQADIDNGEITNQASVSATAPDDSPVRPDQSGDSTTDDNPNVIPICINPKIVLVKTGVFMDENKDGYAQVDETITYTFAVKNTGNVTISNIDITDITNPSIALTFSNNPIATLAPGDIKSITGTYKITQSDIDAGMVTNSALAVGKDPNGDDVRDISGTTEETDDMTVTQLPQKPELTVTKTADREEYSFVGDVINYTIKVQNTGTVTLNDIVVTDELTELGTTFPAFTIPKLVPNEYKEFTQSYTITKADLAKVSVINVAKAIGHDPNGIEVPGSGTVVVEKAIVLCASTIFVNNAFSPNGDGINETFVIDGINNILCIPDNTVEIYNRWGVLVFETRNYNNNSNYFDGISRGRTTISQSSGLPTGTYYYILNYTVVDDLGDLHPNRKDGYLYLTR